MKHLTAPASGTISIIPCGALGPLGADIHPMSRSYGGGRGLVDWRLVDWGSVDWGSIDWGSIDWGLADWGSVDWGLAD